MVGHTNRGRDGYICAAGKYRRGLGCGPGVFVEKSLAEGAVWDTVGVSAERAAGEDRDTLIGAADEGLQRQWEAGGGANAAVVHQRLEKIDRKIGNLRQALEDGVQDVGWVNGRMGTR